MLADSNSTTLRCAVSAGVGSNYVFVLTLGAVPSFSVSGADTLAYPAPLIIKNSLRRNNVNYTVMPAMASSASEGIMITKFFYLSHTIVGFSIVTSGLFLYPPMIIG